MRTETTNIYTFDELSEEQKKLAIESVRESYYQFNEFGTWAIDDDYLLNPTQDDIDNTFTKEEIASLKDCILIGNSRESLYFSTDRNYYLDCAKAMTIENRDLFFKWLGISQDLVDDFRIYTPSGRNSDTTIEFYFESNECDEDEITKNATDKFDNYIQNCLKSIESSIDYRYTDEAIREDIESNGTEFTEDGQIY